MLVLAAFAGALVGAVRDCEQLANFYPGYQDCTPRMTWLKSNWNRLPYNRTIDGTYCSMQKFLSLETQGEDRKPIYACPDPDEDPVADTFKDLGNGVFSMIVYRNLKYSADNPWSRRLLNANGANLHGAFQYLHAEVVPESQRMQVDRDAKARRFGINAIMAFNVTYKNPKPIRDQYGPGNKFLGPFVAYDAGQCTAGPACPNWDKGFFVGVQAGDTSRTKYMGAKWMSFPQCGFCAWPTGEPNCTYTYSVIGKYDIDQMVMGKTLATASGLNPGLKMADGGYITLEPRTYENLMIQGKYEWERPEGKLCPPLSSGVPTTSGLEFWKDPCDEFKCKVRMQRALFAGVIDVSVAGPGEGPAPGSCIPPSLAPTVPPTPPPTNPPTNVVPAPTLPSTPTAGAPTPGAVPTAAVPTNAGTPSTPTARPAEPTPQTQPVVPTPQTQPVPTPQTQAVTDGNTESSGDAAAVWVPIVVIMIVLGLAAAAYVMWKKRMSKSHAYLMTDMDPLENRYHAPDYQAPQGAQGLR